MTNETGDDKDGSKDDPPAISNADGPNKSEQSIRLQESQPNVHGTETTNGEASKESIQSMPHYPPIFPEDTEESSLPVEKLTTDRGTKDKITVVHRQVPDPDSNNRHSERNDGGAGEDLSRASGASAASSVLSEDYNRRDTSHLGSVNDTAQQLDSLGLEAKGEVYDPDILNELVLYDRLGNPYVDIFKLMVNNQKIRQHKKLEELGFANFTPHIVFILGKLVTLIISAITFLLGCSIVTFIASVRSTFGHLIPGIDKNVRNAATILNFKYFHPRLRKALTQNPGDAQTTGIILIVTAVINSINSVTGIYGFVQIYPRLLVTHNVVNFLIIGAQIFLSLSDPHCDFKDAVKFGDRFIGYMNTYAITFDLEDQKEPAQFAAIQLDEIQISMDCCGAYSWLDYLDEGIINPVNSMSNSSVANFTRDRQQRRELSNTELVFPASCCKQWWIKNIYCAVGMHLVGHTAADPQELLIFRERISQNGCVPAIFNVCKRTSLLINPILQIICAIHSTSFILECISVRIVRKRVAELVREKLHAAKREAAEQTGEGFSDTSLTLEQPGKLAGAMEAQLAGRNVPLPTEDQIELIKSRSDFNKFEATMANTHVGEWISQARQAVFRSNRRTTAGQNAMLSASTGSVMSRLSFIKRITDKTDSIHEVE